MLDILGLFAETDYREEGATLKDLSMDSMSKGKTEPNFSLTF